MAREPDLRRVLTHTIQHACRALGADNGRIGIVAEDESAIHIEAIYRPTLSDQQREWCPGEGLPGLVLRSKQPLVVNRGADRHGNHCLDPHENSALGVPIVFHGTFLGYFGLGSYGSVRFGQSHAEQLGQFADLAAIAIQNSRLTAESRKSLAQASALLETTEKIGNAMSVPDVIRAYLEQVAHNGRYTCTVVLYEFDKQGNKIGNTVMGRWAPGSQVELMEYRVSTKRDFLDPILAAGKSVRIANALTDPGVPRSLRDEQRRDNRPAVALVPLMADRQRIGLVILSDPTPHEWTDEELVPFQATAAQLASMLASRRDHDAMIESSQQLAVLEERRKIARDLHDSVTQILFSLNLMSQSISSDAPVPGETVEKLQSLSRRGLQEMRSLLEELRPVSIDAKPMSLGQKIASYAADVVGLPAFTLDDQSYEAQDASVENQFLGIAQEALNNVAKHSKAGHVSLLLQTDPAGCLLKIEDDGEGFSESSCKSGHGLNTMRERAGEIQAKLEIQSEPGKGTVIQLVRGRGQNGNSNRNRRRP